MIESLVRCLLDELKTLWLCNTEQQRLNVSPLTAKTET